MITHKLTELMGRDTLLVVGDRHILAQGKHDELLRTSQLYQTLWSYYLGEDTESAHRP